jgi:protein phosphatase 1G
MGAYLSSPVTNKVKADRVGDTMSAGSCAMQGWRKDMEDSHFELLPFREREGDSLFGVFDGHGGSAVARFCSENFPTVLMRDEQFIAGDVKEGLRRTYLRLDEMLLDPSNVAILKKYAKRSHSSGGDTPPAVVERRSATHPASNTGCTAVVVHVSGTKLTVANSGDSRAVLCQNGEAVDLTIDHKVTLESERDRISAAGGVVLNGRVNGSLNLTRALGDLAFKGDSNLKPEDQVITANPDVFEIDLDPETCDFLIIACDGLFEVFDSQEACDYVSHGLRFLRGAEMPASPDSTASEPPTSISDIVARMLDVACSDDVGKTEGLGGDNLTCIVVDLRPGKLLSNVDRVIKYEDDGGEFVLKPNSYKVLEFRSNSSSSSSGSDVFSHTDECESRVERLEGFDLSEDQPN